MAARDSEAAGDSPGSRKSWLSLEFRLMTGVWEDGHAGQKPTSVLKTRVVVSIAGSDGCLRTCKGEASRVRPLSAHPSPAIASAEPGLETLLGTGRSSARSRKPCARRRRRFVERSRSWRTVNGLMRAVRQHDGSWGRPNAVQVCGAVDCSRQTGPAVHFGRRGGGGSHRRRSRTTARTVTGGRPVRILLRHCVQRVPRLRQPVSTACERRSGGQDLQRQGADHPPGAGRGGLQVKLQPEHPVSVQSIRFVELLKPIGPPSPLARRGLQPACPSCS